MLRGFRDRWDIPIKNLQKTLDQSVFLIQKTICYLEDIQQVTAKVSTLVDRVEALVEREEALRELETEKIRLEIEILKHKRTAQIGRFEKRPRIKGGKGK